MVDETPPEPRFERFFVRYLHVVLDSVWSLGGGGTLRQVQVEHPMAVVEPDEGSQVNEAPT
jgi:hypothetical protein